MNDIKQHIASSGKNAGKWVRCTAEKNCRIGGAHRVVPNILSDEDFLTELDNLDKKVDKGTTWEQLLNNDNNSLDVENILSLKIGNQTIREALEEWSSEVENLDVEIDFTEYLSLQNTMKKCVILSEEGPQDTQFYIHALNLAKQNTKEDFDITFDDEASPDLKLQIQYDEEGNILPNRYLLSGVQVNGEPVELAIVQSGGSFVDYLVYLQDSEEDNLPLASEEPVIGIEVTKTSDKESGNSSVGQRATKFTLWPYAAPTALVYETSAAGWNEERTSGNTRQTRALLNLVPSISIRQNDGTYTTVENELKAYENVEEVLAAWAPPKKLSKSRQDTYMVRRDENNIDLYCRIYQTDKYSDPGIGMTALITSSLRKLGYEGNITLHGHTYPKNVMSGDGKQINVLINNDVQLDGVTFDNTKKKTKNTDYFRPATTPEKLGTIYSQIEASHKGQATIYSNHGGAERSSLIATDGSRMTVPKKNGENKIGIPDLVLTHEKEVLLIEGKKYETSYDAVEQIVGLDQFQDFAEKKAGYSSHTFDKGIALYGGTKEDTLHKDVIKNLYLWVRTDGTILHGDKYKNFSGNKE